MTIQEIKFLRKTIINRDIKDKEEWKLSRELIKKCYEELTAMGYEIPLFSNLDELVVLKAEEVFVEETKEVNIYKGKNWFEKVEKVNGEYVFFEIEEDNEETPNIKYSLSELDKQIKDYKENGYKVKIYNC